ncbi:tetratricopeptide repeat protein [Aggregicoccus sp. 17bor-14]|uniref:serine/threonine-protein kinase n=1 Tax=Myxococcaceae TaxID=31 RepID=UPI00129D031B|nr:MULTISPECIES: serine/threonine-protein kinase [Myxococcaceae]MBF5045153.1 serine/threonine protein kinase [Simulacricoccus sp. 17bor-14]MRI90895.1 tetratricopeptide repeat protein [Aggregicoccus sp. 17bor-14]
MGSLGCLDEGRLWALAQGEATATAAEARHLETCEACGERSRTHLLPGSLAQPAPRAGDASGEDEPTPEIGAPQPLAPQPQALPRGSSLGRYLVLERLGAGGMGEVYAAFDPQLNRKVALKLLLPRAAGADGKARLLREAQAMAQLSHPNVLPVFDAGEADGRVFIAMELVEGTTLRAWLLERRRPWPEVLRPFLEAGRGLAAAHAAGLVHRDFKPDNVLLGPGGRVYVMDFGLACAGEERAPAPDLELQAPEAEARASGTLLHASLTHAGSLVGTPGYMAPEQYSRAVLDGRADAFGFCAALYFGLYGKKPFVGKDARSLMRATLAGEVQPPPPDAHVPAWLQRVVLRGLSVSPDARFPTMEALLAALQQDPRARQRRWALASAAALALLGAWGVQRHLAGRERAQCESEAQAGLGGVWSRAQQGEVASAFAGSGKPYAQGALARVRTALDAYVERWRAQREDACLATHVRGEASARVLQLRTGCLEHKRAELSALTDVLAHADAQVVEKAVSLANGLSSLEACADVDALMHQVPPPESPALAQKVEDLRGRLARGRVLRGAGKFKEGVALVEPLLAEARGLHYRPLEAEAEYLLGLLQGSFGDKDAGERHLKQAVWAAEATNHDETKLDALTGLVSVIGFDSTRAKESEEWFQLAEAVLSRRPGDVDAAQRLYSVRGAVLLVNDKYVEGEALLRRALALVERSAGPDSIEAADVHQRLGQALENQGKYEEALVSYGRSRAVFERVFGPEHPQVGYALITTASALGELRRQEAAELAERGVAILEKALSASSPKLGAVLNNAAVVMEQLERYPQALSMYQRALKVKEAGFGPEHPSSAITCTNVGIVLTRLGRAKEALPYLQRSIAVFEKGPDPEGANMAHPLTGYGEALLNLDQPAKAVAPLQRALRIRDRAEVAPRLKAQTRYLLAHALWESRQDRPRAAALAHQALEQLVSEDGQPLRREVQRWMAESGVP